MWLSFTISRNDLVYLIPCNRHLTSVEARCHASLTKAQGTEAVPVLPSAVAAVEVFLCLDRIRLASQLAPTEDRMLIAGCQIPPYPSLDIVEIDILQLALDCS